VIIEGGDSTHGVAFGHTYQNGGHIRILKATGWSGTTTPDGGLICQANTTQVVQSAPAVGQFLARGAMGIVTGTGTFYANASDSHKLIAINTSCQRVWTDTLDGVSLPSPALADLSGTGQLDVVAMAQSGTVYALNGTNGHVLWTYKIPGGAVGGATTFQSPTGNFQYVLAPGYNGLDVLDGRTGALVEKLTGFTLRSSATVTADPNGEIGITVAGTNLIEHFEIPGSHVTTVQTPGAWPEFHHDPQLTGFTGYTAPPKLQTTPPKPCATTGPLPTPNCVF
jgi:outer membrane protein assembly factor BamB